MLSQARRLRAPGGAECLQKVALSHNIIVVPYIFKCFTARLQLLVSASAEAVSPSAIQYMVNVVSFGENIVFPLLKALRRRGYRMLLLGHYLQCGKVSVPL